MAKHEGNPKAASFRIQSDNAKGYVGQRRHDLRIGHQPGYVDLDRLDLNRVLIEPPAPSVMRRIAEDHRSRRNTQRAMKSNAAISTAGIITFGSEAAQMFDAIPSDQQDRALKLLARSAAMKLRTPLLSLVVHNDEATIHAHMTYSAYTRDGVPVSKATRPSDMSAMQDLTARVMQRFCPGIERGHRYGDRIAAGADYADTLHKSVRELHRDLPADLAAKRQALADLVQTETDAQARVDEMRDRVQKLEAKEELTAKELKRLQTYENRLADRVAELQTVRAASEAARAEADRLADLARIDRQNEEARADTIRAKADAVGAAVAALSEEVEARTIRRGDDGRIKAAQPDRLKPGFPEIRPAVVAAADFVTGIDAARADLAADQEELQQQHREMIEDRTKLKADIAAVTSLHMKLQEALKQVARWLKLRMLPQEIQKEGMDLLRESAKLVSAPKEPLEEPDTGLSGPGF